MPDDKTMIDYTNKMKSYLRSAEVVEGKNHAYSQENNAVIATIENGESYKVRWTGSATVTLKKNSASGTEVTSGSTSPLSFTADSDFDLYFGSSADVTEIMVYDGNDTSDTYEPYYVPVKDSKLSIKDQQVLGAWNFAKNTLTSQTIDGIHITVNSDKSVTIYTDAGGATQRNNISIFQGDVNQDELNKYGNQHYYMSGCPKGGSTSTYFMYLHPGKTNGTWNPAVKDVGNGTEFDYDGNSLVFYAICIMQGTVITTPITFYPQIALKPNQPYKPYAMTNMELTDKQNNPYIILATATASASTTYGNLFSVIKTAYNALPADKKVRCEIWQNTNGSSLIFRNFAGIGVFTSMVISSGNALFYIVRFDNNDYRKLTFSTDGTMTNADFSSQLQSQNLYLVMR